MKVLVLSDSHGNLKNLEFAIKNFPHDMIFFLGDGYKDFKAFSDEEIYAVKGNCDFFVPAEEEEILEIEGNKIMLCHGHLFGVKYTMSEIAKKAQKENLKLVCFGHTHKFLNMEIDGCTFLNPGSIGAMCENSFALLTVSKSNIKVVKVPVANN